jgi:hypothetical protein
LQVQWILEAVFARLGVKHEARNFGNGGLGTVHNAISTGSCYGPDVDMLMWDSGMTEGGDTAAIDLFGRQGLLGGTKVPVLWSLAGTNSQLLNMNAEADVGFPGSGYIGIPEGKTLEEIQQMPWASQYVRCNNALHGICRSNEYQGVCWIDRDDYTPKIAQKNAPGGRANWHPGNRIHQVTGRILAFTILQALKEALTLWNETDGYILEDSVWHVTERYDKIRSGMAALPNDAGDCPKYEEIGLASWCKYPMKVRIRRPCSKLRLDRCQNAKSFSVVVTLGSHRIHSPCLSGNEQCSKFDAAGNACQYQPGHQE